MVRLREKMFRLKWFRVNLPAQFRTRWPIKIFAPVSDASLDGILELISGNKIDFPDQNRHFERFGNDFDKLWYMGVDTQRVGPVFAKKVMNDSHFRCMRSVCSTHLAAYFPLGPLLYLLRASPSIANLLGRRAVVGSSNWHAVSGLTFKQYYCLRISNHCSEVEVSLDILHSVVQSWLAQCTIYKLSLSRCSNAFVVDDRGPHHLLSTCITYI